jgi:hypothetical protein
MLTLPSIHPFLLTLLKENVTEKDLLTGVPRDSWPAIVEAAITQRTVPALLRWLDHPPHCHDIPLPLVNVLKHQVVQHTAWHLLLAKELRDILTACEQRGIACVPIRGPVLAEQLHGDGSTRRMDDLDLLVHHEDLSAIKNIFEHLRYVNHEHRPGFLEAFSYSLEFVHPNHGFLVEPHWTLAYPPFMDGAAMKPVWRRVRRRQWRGINICTLAHEDLLLHLCLHLHHKGRQAPLLWFYELDIVIRRHGPTLDWDSFLNQVQLMRQARSVYDVLTIVMDTFYSPVPESVTKRLAAQAREDPLPSFLSVRTQILAYSSLSGREELALLCSLQSLQQRLRYLVALLFPSPCYMIRRYGASTRIRLIGYYIFRFIHIGTEGLRWSIAWVGTFLTARSNSSIRG